MLTFASAVDPNGSSPTPSIRAASPELLPRAPSSHDYNCPGKPPLDRLSETSVMKAPIKASCFDPSSGESANESNTQVSAVKERNTHQIEADKMQSLPEDKDEAGEDQKAFGKQKSKRKDPKERQAGIKKTYSQTRRAGAKEWRRKAALKAEEALTDPKPTHEEVKEREGLVSPDQSIEEPEKMEKKNQDEPPPHNTPEDKDEAEANQEAVDGTTGEPTLREKTQGGKKSRGEKKDPRSKGK